jgi:hypothetical protein
MAGTCFFSSPPLGGCPVGANSLRESTMKDLYTEVTNRIIVSVRPVHL